MSYLVVDTNIFFNALLHLSGNTTKIFLYQEEYGIGLVAPTYLIGEVEKYASKLAKKRGISEEEIQRLIGELFDHISFIDYQYYEDSFVIVEKEMCEIDPKDTDFVALSHKFGCPLWTNDRKLKQMITSVAVVNTQDVLGMCGF